MALNICVYIYIWHQIYMYMCMCVCVYIYTHTYIMSLSRLQELVMDRETWSAASMESQRIRHSWATELDWCEEYWSGMPFPSPVDLLDPGIKPRSPALRADSLPSEPPVKPISMFIYIYICIYWRRKWQHTPVYLPGESYEQRSLEGFSPWGHEESDTTEVT